MANLHLDFVSNLVSVRDKSCTCQINKWLMVCHCLAHLPVKVGINKLFLLSTFVSNVCEANMIVLNWKKLSKAKKLLFGEYIPWNEACGCCDENDQLEEVGSVTRDAEGGQEFCGWDKRESEKQY